MVPNLVKNGSRQETVREELRTQHQGRKRSKDVVYDDLDPWGAASLPWVIGSPALILVVLPSSDSLCLSFPESTGIGQDERLEPRKVAGWKRR